MVNKKIRAVIFDLDGTLINSLDDIADCANRVLADYNIPPYPVECYRSFVGNGLFILMKRIMPKETNNKVLSECAIAFKRLYQQNWNKKTVPYPGISSLLDQLDELGLKTAVLSNKPDGFTQECVTGFFPGYPFFPILGQTEAILPKPAPDGANKIAETLGIDPQNFIFVGDSNVDITTGIAANMKTIGVSWGFRPRDELVAAGAAFVINHPQELLYYVRNN